MNELEELKATQLILAGTVAATFIAVSYVSVEVLR